MGFRDEYLLSGKTYAEYSLENTVGKGFESNNKILSSLGDTLKDSLDSGFEYLANVNSENADSLRSEIKYQSDMLADTINQCSTDTIMAIQGMADYLGGSLNDIRWGIECHTKVSIDILNVMLESLDNESRQYYHQGVKCYELGENDFAKERFLKALESNKTNYFAYQYLGFISVKENTEHDAIRYFDLAQKFATSNYHKALALGHLARCYFAGKNYDKAVQTLKLATEVDPDITKLWYELATYAARIDDSNCVTDSLTTAIDKDKTYYAITISDLGKSFDNVKNKVILLLKDIRNNEKNKAEKALSHLSEAISSANSVAQCPELDSCENIFKNLVADVGSKNFYIYIKANGEATETIEMPYTIAYNSLQIAMTQTEELVDKNQAVNTQKLNKLNNVLEENNNARLNLKFVDAKIYNISIAFIAFVVYLILFVTTIDKIFSSLSQLLIPTVIYIAMIVTIIFVNKERYAAKNNQLTSGYDNKLNDINSQLNQLQNDYQKEVNNVNTKLNAMKEYSKKCLNRQPFKASIL